MFLSLSVPVSVSQEVSSISCLWVGGASDHPAPTCRQHLGAFAEAVVVVCISGAEVGALEDQAALVPRRPAVPTQRKPGGHPEVVMGERSRIRLGLVEEGALLWLFWDGEPQPGVPGPSPLLDCFLCLLPLRDQAPTVCQVSLILLSLSCRRVSTIVIITIVRTMANIF